MIGRDTDTPMVVRSEESEQAQLDPAVEGELAAHLDRLAQIIREIEEQVGRLGARYVPELLAEHRPVVYHTLIALGDWLNEFLAGAPAPSESRALRHRVAATLREWSRTSPLLQYSLSQLRSLGGNLDLTTWLLDTRPADADVRALVLNDFYAYSVGGRAYRGRMKLLVSRVWDEIERRVAAGSDPVRILSLHISGAGEFLSLEQAETLAAHVQVTCLDANAQALRAATRALPKPLKSSFSFVRADALRYVAQPDRPAQSFDLIYAMGTFDHLGVIQAAQLAGDCHSLLAPGGILLAGSSTPGIPAGEQILRAWVTDWDIRYRDEMAWREIFAHTDFDPATLRFEYEPLKANMLVSAERSP